MKSLICAILFLISLNSPCSTALASENKVYYAKVLTESTFFYSSCTEHSALFEIPVSYFVMLTGHADDAFYSARYGSLSGYVKKEEVTPMKNTPASPYATNQTYRVTSMSGLNLMSLPTFSSQTLANLNFLEENLTFYGKIQGQEFFPNSTKTWYYCSYNSAGENLYGYVFSYYCDTQSSLPMNNEYFEEITETLTFQNAVTGSITPANTLTAIIILAVAIPLLILIYFFLTPKKSKQKSSKVVKRHKDYYELSENDLN